MKTTLYLVKAKNIKKELFVYSTTNDSHYLPSVGTNRLGAYHLTKKNNRNFG